MIDIYRANIVNELPAFYVQQQCITCFLFSGEMCDMIFIYSNNVLHAVYSHFTTPMHDILFIYSVNV